MASKEAEERREETESETVREEVEERQKIDAFEVSDSDKPSQFAAKCEI